MLVYVSALGKDGSLTAAKVTIGKQKSSVSDKMSY